MAVCAKCETTNPDGAKFCSECGARLGTSPRRDERKTVTVLFADLVGFTARSEALDVEDVRGLLAPYHAFVRTTLERFGGTVEKFIGDAVMAVFGAPNAHEDDAERAVRAGLAIRDGIGEVSPGLHVRIGINTGEALVTLSADAAAGEAFVAGDVVNTASRLQAAAPVDQVLVGATTYRAAEREIVFEPHEPINAKGKAQPVECWMVQRPRALVPQAHRDLPPLIGRDRELRMLTEAFERCRADRTVQLVTVVGVPGMGKTRLLDELRQHLELEPTLTTWRSGRVLPYGDGVAFHAIAEIVAQECGILHTDDNETIERKLDDTIAALGLVGADAAWVRNQTSALVGVEREFDGSGRDRAFAGWRMLVEAVAAATPTVVLFEDLHWADDAMLDFVDELVDRAGDVPLLVAATARPELLERRPYWGGGHPNALAIALHPLTPAETAALVDTIIDRRLLPTEAEEMLVTRAGGNPLYAQEFARMVVEQGAAAATTLPDSVQGIIAARLDGLDADEKALLQDAAVVGDPAWLGALCTNRTREDAERILRRLERKQLVRTQRHSDVSGESQFTFAHALIRDVAYRQLPRAAQAERHRHVGDWMTTWSAQHSEFMELAARQYARALEILVTDPAARAALATQVVDVFVGAARQAAQRHDESAARRWAELALAHSDDPLLRAELLVLAAVGAMTAGEADEDMLIAARDAARLAGRQEDAVHLTYLLSEWAEYFPGDHDRVIRYEREALDLARTLPPGPVAALATYSAAYRLVAAGQYQQAIELCEIEIRRCRAAGEASAEALVLLWSGTARAELGDAQGISDIERAVAILEETGHPKAARAIGNLVIQLVGLGRLEQAQRECERAIVAAQRTGDVVAVDLLRELLANMHWHHGDDEAARRELVTLSEATGGALAANVATTRSALLLEHDPTQSLSAALDAVRVAREMAAAELEAEALACVARAHLACGDPDAASAAADEYLTLWSTLPGQSWFGKSIVDIAIVLAAIARHDDLLVALKQVHASNPWADAARALAEHRDDDAASILGAIPSVPLRDAVRAGAASPRR